MVAVPIELVDKGFCDCLTRAVVEVEAVEKLLENWRE